MVAHVLWEHGVAGSNPVNPTRMGISLPMDLTRAGGCPGSTTGSAGRRNQHIRDHWQEGSKSVGERRHPSPIRRASPGRSLGSQPSLFRLADYTSPPCDVSEKSTAMRMWCSGSTPASQAGNRGFEPRHPLHPENQNNGSDPTMGLVTVLSMWTLPEKTWTNSLGMGTHRQGREHAIAPVAQRKSRCLLSTGSGYRNSVGARCLVNRRA